MRFFQCCRSQEQGHCHEKHKGSYEAAHPPNYVLELQLKRDPKPLVTTANRRHDRLSPDLAVVEAVRGAQDHQQSDDGIRLHPCK